VASIVNMHEAKSTLSRLVERVLAGEEVVIARDGKPVAKLVPVRPAAGARRPGRLKGRVRLADDFDSTPDAVVRAFEGDA
jgi:prevent-host-death family protein